MVIGIDLDNTIIDYRNSFWNTAVTLKIFSENELSSFFNNDGRVPNKNQIKNRIIEKKNNFKWEFLQGQVYGKYINNAAVYPGVANFLLHCKRRRVKVYIISHKTKYGHHDKSQIPLRESAIKLLTKNNLLSGDYGIRDKDIFFFDTRFEKVKKISELDCNYFIDDLPEVFSEKNFPDKTKKILFNNQFEGFSSNWAFNTWMGINKFIFGEIETTDIALYAEKGLSEKVKSVRIVKGRGNSRIYKIQVVSGQEFAAKFYPDSTFDNRHRLEKEAKACRFMYSNGINSVPKHFWSDLNLNFSLFEWIDGKEIVNVNDTNIRRAAEFVESLFEISKYTDNKDFPLATAACLNGEMIEKQIIRRYSKIIEIKDLASEVMDFLKDDFSITFEKVLSKSKKTWPGNFCKELHYKYQILSPSDFGFHNTFLTKDGLKFFDFEYFGWDDPVKLTCDFLLHPGMHLSKKQKNLWLQSMQKIFSNDKIFFPRLISSYGLYGLCWCLIMLNIFTDSYDNENYKVLGESFKIERKKKSQLEKAMDMLMHVNETYEKGL